MIMNYECHIPKVSVIVPVHNPPINRLKVCLNSVLQQDYSNTELVVVDDGSNSETKEWLSSFCAENPGVVLITQENQGVSTARNNGFTASSGEYITFLDCDDELESGYIKQGAQIIEECDADIVLGLVGFIRSEEDKEIISAYQVSGAAHEVSPETLIRYHLTSKSSNPAIPRYGTEHSCALKLKNGPICRLVKRGISSNVSFPAGLAINEDTVWNIDLLLHAKKAVVVNRCWYWYWQVAGSTVHRYRANFAKEAEAAVLAIEDVLGEEGLQKYGIEFLNKATGEINRAARNCVHPECPLSFFQQVAIIQSIYKELDIASLAKRVHGKSLYLCFKLLLCKTGLNVIAVRFKGGARRALSGG